MPHYLPGKLLKKGKTCVASGPAKNGLPFRQVLSFSSDDWVFSWSADGRDSNLLESPAFLAPPK